MIFRHIVAVCVEWK